jgi:hypothetical protein
MHPPFRHAYSIPPSGYVCGTPGNTVSVRLLAHNDAAWAGIIASRAKLCDRIMAGWRFGDPPQPPPEPGRGATARACAEYGEDYDTYLAAYKSFLDDYQSWQRVLGNPDAIVGRPNVEVVITEGGIESLREGFRLVALAKFNYESAKTACKFLGKQLKNPQRSAWGAAGSDGAAQFWLAMVLQASRLLRDGG